MTNIIRVDFRPAVRNLGSASRPDQMTDLQWAALLDDLDAIWLRARANRIAAEAPLKIVVKGMTNEYDRT